MMRVNMTGILTNMITGFKSAAVVLANHQRKTQVRKSLPRKTKVRTNRQRKMKVKTSHQSTMKARISHPRKTKVRTNRQRKTKVRTNHQRMTKVRTNHQRKTKVRTNHQRKTKVRTNHQRKMKVRTNHQRKTKVRTSHQRKTKVRTNHQRKTMVRTNHQRKMKKSTGAGTGSTGRKYKRMETSMLDTSTKTVTTFLIWSSFSQLSTVMICTQQLFQKATSIFNVGKVNLTLMTTQIISMMSMISVENSKVRRKKKETNHSAANTKIKLSSKKK